MCRGFSPTFFRNRIDNRGDLRLLLAAGLILLTACTGELPAEGPDPKPTTQSDAQHEPAAPPGQGFVVWESNRTSTWRLWIRDFDGSAPRQLTAEAENRSEADRQHCCPHISPDGRSLIYLKLPRGQEGYPESGASGPMHLLDLESSEERTLVDEARTYFEHRAVVWRSDSELIYIDASGVTQSLDVTSGESRPLTAKGEERHGWLINSRLTHATTGRPSFSTYDSNAREIEPSKVLGGCQPYFSYDGRWGFWVAGAGGPIRALELAGRRTVEVLTKSDPRLPAGQGYLYFPMLSHDSTLLAVAASPDQHDHLKSNYDVFVAAVDPDTLEVLGDAWRVTSDEASDRFPDVYARPLALGRHFGEAPLKVTFQAGDGSNWQWNFGDGNQRAAGARVGHSFEQPGSYPIEASGPTTLRGFVRVRAARPPAVAGVAIRRGREVVIHFDEEVDLKTAKAELTSGLAIDRLDPGDEGHSLIVTLADELETFDTLRLDGVRDRAQRPNAMPPVELEIAPPLWPADRRGLLFLWDNQAATNEIEDPETGRFSTSRLTPQGRAWLDRHQALELAGGSFFADDDSVLRVLGGARRTNELTLEATFTPRDPQTPEMSRIISFSGGLRSRNFTLGQQGDRLVLRLRTATTGQNADRPQLDIGPLRAGRPTHVVVTYTAGQLRAWLDGRKTLDSDAVQDGFFHWKARPLVFGNEWQAERPWFGTLEAIAAYDRALSEEEALESHRRAMRRLEAKSQIPVSRLRTTLTGRSRIPSLQEIAPYREALAVYEYRIEEVLAGDFTQPTVRVVHRVLADGEALPVGRRAEGRSYELEVESFFDHPQLESLVLSNTLPEQPDSPLFFSSAID